MLYSSSLDSSELFDYLNELALDLHWSWSHATDKIWRQLDPVLWELTRNPLFVLQTVSNQRISKILDDPFVREIIEELIQVKRQNYVAPAWFQKAYPHAALSCIAYFSMEYMLSEALPIYAGGLGNVAGDHLKSASDLGVPLVGIGLLYQQGYSHQVINRDGTQQHVFPFNDPGQLPLSPLRNEHGEWLRIEIRLRGFSIWLRTWKVQVGRVMLLLLDSNDPANFSVHRGITAELYGGGPVQRLLQELILGIGGWRLLKALQIKPEVCHMNEGHSSFVVLERARDFMEENDQPFDVALAVTRAGNLFTTHTAIGAGFDRFPPDLVRQYLESYANEKLRISLDDLLALGRQNPHDVSEYFNTAYLAIRGCGHINAVSKLHGQVSRSILRNLFPRWPDDEIPVSYVTNGVHMPTWDSSEADALWTEACGKSRWMGTMETMEQDLRKIPVEKIWKLRCEVKKKLIEYIRARYSRQLATSNFTMQEIEAANLVLDPGVLTLGFARRFVSYKRPNLLLHDRERLKRLLTNPDKPVQLVLAGKAHPGDEAGQALIKQWIQFISSEGLNQHVLFLSDYDMLLTEHLVQGVDVWINTPKRPWEACGTSGMKVLVNGGLNLSELDGWWNEAYDPKYGWALGDGQDHGDNPDWDAKEAEELYSLLEQEIIPAYYQRNDQDIPLAWVNRITESMAMLTPRFSANRSVREYTETHYLKAASAYLERAAHHGETGRQILDWSRGIDEKWAELRFHSLYVETNEAFHRFDVEIYLHDIGQENICVELYAEGLNGDEPFRKQMKPAEIVSSEPGITRYSAMAPSHRPASEYTARVILRHNYISVPLECNHIMWQR